MVKGNHLPWIDPELISLLQRYKAWSIFCRTRTNADWEVYRQLRTMTKTKTRNAKSNYYKESLSSNFIIKYYKLKLLSIHPINILLIKYELLIQYYVTPYLLLKHSITISPLFVLSNYPNLIRVLAFLIILRPVTVLFLLGKFNQMKFRMPLMN